MYHVTFDLTIFSMYDYQSRFEMWASIKTKSALRKLFRNHLSNEDNLYINWLDLTQSIECLFRMKGVLVRNLIIHYLSSFFASYVKLSFRF